MNFTGTVKAGGLLPVGLCSECRGDVARVMEAGWQPEPAFQRDHWGIVCRVGDDFESLGNWLRTKAALASLLDESRAAEGGIRTWPVG